MSFILTDQLVGIYLAPIRPQSAESLLELRLRNRSVHSRYEPKREESFFTLNGQKQLILQRMEEEELDRAYMFGIYSSEEECLIGQITINNIVRGVGQFADLGYFIDYAQQGRGYMTGAVGLAANYAFQSLGLHRLQAAILLHNDASRRVLEKNGFQAEGIARRFLKIDGQWQDHRTYALLADEVTSEGNRTM
ncbi:ribosomal-protein-alanine N-acetyltransferase [Paenibacillus sophorae]|uniref:GNAT family N-acetyltransferase n=1 Tax=Paenibacillus sophorae TaxID=1333845 RepID=A0A1H8VZ05_9BACL|nr:GNAT family protein [Paenibacillus sophorae]QWU16376.1 GNAT family N-acetyltransferase [Paenibacillus sophorae]SEP20629.1 ribosomal-protein-alanine N-acetyltransferase [Paenibacillus sophorae]